MTTITLSGGAALTTEQKTALRVEIGAQSATDVTTAASNAIAAHASAADPHPQYMTQSEGDQRYAPAGITGATNLTATASPTGITVNSDTGTDAPLPLADSTNAGLMAPEQVTKLGGVADGATANATDAQLRDRSTHTGVQAISTVTGLQDALDSKATTEQGAKADSALQPGAHLTQSAVTAATSAGVALLSAADAAAQRTALGLGTAATTAASAYATAAQGTKADNALQNLTDMQTAFESGTSSQQAAFQSSVSGASTDDGNLITAGTDNKLKLVGSAIAGWLAGIAANLGIGTASPLARLHVAGGSVCVDNAHGYQGRLQNGAVATLMRYKVDNKAYVGPNEEIVLDGSCSIAPPGELTLSAGVASSTGPTIRPKSGITINGNGLMAFDAVSNTQVALKFRGNDGVTRSIVFTLS